MKNKYCLTFIIFLPVFFLHPNITAQNVGIGTITPSEKLEVIGGIKLGPANNNNPGTIIYSNNKFQGRIPSGWQNFAVPTGSMIIVDESNVPVMELEGYSVIGKTGMLTRPIVAIGSGNWLPQNYGATGGNYLGNRRPCVWANNKLMIYVNNIIYALDTTTNSWSQSIPCNVPGFAAREGATMVWAAEKNQLIIYGGYINVGGINTAQSNCVKYEPTLNTWSSNTAAPVARAYPSAIWSGTDMYVFGGDSTGTNGICTGIGYHTNTLYKYNYDLNSWTGPISTSGTSPTPRRQQQSFFTGTKMLVFSGYTGFLSTCANGNLPGSSASYLSDLYELDLGTNIWTVKAENTGVSYQQFVGGYTGQGLVIWGYKYNANAANPQFFNYGKLYNQAGNSWSAYSEQNAFLSISNSVGAWTGESLIITDGFVWQKLKPYDGSTYKIFTDNFSSETSYYLMRKN